MTNFLTQKAQIFDEVLGDLINISFKVKIDVAAFWATFGNNWQLFITTSGHTVHSHLQLFKFPKICLE